MSERRDKRGRRIGRNWWREYVWGEWHAAYHAWWLDREAVALGYSTEMHEYGQENPAPTFRAFLESLAGCGRIAA